MLRVKLFGSIDVERHGRRLPPFPTRNASSLFGYLLLHQGRSHYRVRLAGTFWPDCPEATALKRLRTALWRIRSVLEAGQEEHPEAYILTERRRVAWNGDAALWLDVVEFEDFLRKAEEARNRGAEVEELRLLRRAISLYRGDLLEQIYHEWALVEQERIRRLVVGSYERLMQAAVERANWRRAVAYGQRILRHDPFCESVHRSLMRLYYRMGDRPAALRQFSRCRELLQKSLQIEPMERTRDLERAIRDESLEARAPLPPLHPRPRRRTPPESGRVRALFASVNRDLERVLEKMRGALDELPPETPSTET